MTRLFLLVALLLAAPAGAQTVERVYILDCGQGRAQDTSRWTPGVNVGVPMDLVDHCYLIRHRQGWMMWDTGVPERVAQMPDGLVGGGGTLVWKRPKTIAAQLAEIGVRPEDVRLVAISHTHGDHVGNVGMFTASTVLIQKAEYDWAFARPEKPFSAEHKAQKLEGDHDVWGDGSVRIISTPGHTPGHQSLLVRIEKTGYVLLAGDAAHFRDVWENRRVPAMNVNREQTLALMQRMADLLAQHKGEIWFNHDKAQRDTQKLAPAFYD
jgi:glyoxylase-like metal-dependent hydrolase (beta-lactamase superfamily II)